MRPLRHSAFGGTGLSARIFRIFKVIGGFSRFAKPFGPSSSWSKSRPRNQVGCAGVAISMGATEVYFGSSFSAAELMQ